MQLALDKFSPPVREILQLDPSAYSRLLPSQPGNQTAREMIEQLQDLFAPGIPSTPIQRQTVLAALWLWHDWLDLSHSISGELPTPTGSCWHAIVHRRQGDFPSSKYWYARAGDHPMFIAMASHAGDLVNAFPADLSLLRLVARGWNPAAFVDLVQEISHRPDDPRFRIAVELQRLEWRLLFQM